MNITEINSYPISKSDETKYRNIISSCENRLIVNNPFHSKTIISYGLIVFALDTKRWIIVQRKHSIELLLFISGNYRLSNLSIILSSITQQEAQLIINCYNNTFDYFKSIYLQELNLTESNISYSYMRLIENKNIVLKILEHINLSSKTLQWTWPKGRLQIYTKENGFDCAKREFHEEIELELPTSIFVSDHFFIDHFRTFLGVDIEARFWIYIIPNELPLSPPSPSHPEVSNRIWIDIANSYSFISNKNLLNHLSSFLSSNSFI